MPISLFSMGTSVTDCPVEDRQNPWWYISMYIHMLVDTNVIDDAGQAEVKSYFDLLASKTNAMDALRAQEALLE
eukprot:12113341-Heterocapsa_arctica.AAC.1